MANTQPQNYAVALNKARSELTERDPDRVVRGASVEYLRDEAGAGRFCVPFWCEAYDVRHPGGQVRNKETGDTPSITTQLLLLHYLVTADGFAPQGRWVAFRELPGAQAYAATFRARTRPIVANAYGRDVARFQSVGTSLDGERLTYGDASFRFRIFPRLNVAVALRLADDEFPADAWLLFDASAYHYLPVEDLAVVGELVAKRLAQPRQGATLG